MSPEELREAVNTFLADPKAVVGDNPTAANARAMELFKTARELNCEDVAEQIGQAFFGFKPKTQHTATHCHCGKPRESSDHCSFCGCEEYESTCDRVYVADVIRGEAILPLPNQQFENEIVIASIWQNDDAEFGPIFGLLLTLAKEPPFFTMREITWQNEKWVTNHQEQFHNIVPAVDAYIQNGGDH